MNKKLIVISGCSGGGKSMLIDELKNNGYSVIPEIGRDIVKEQLQSNGNITPTDYLKVPVSILNVLLVSTCSFPGNR